MTEYLKRRPFLVCAIGCIIASVLGFLSETALLCFSVIPIILLLSFLIKKQFKNILIAVVIILCCLSALWTGINVTSIENFDGKTATAKFVVEEINHQFNNRYYATATLLDGPKKLCGTKLSVCLKYPKADIGDILEGDLTFNKVDFIVR